MPLRPAAFRTALQQQGLDHVSCAVERQKKSSTFIIFNQYVVVAIVLAVAVLGFTGEHRVDKATGSCPRAVVEGQVAHLCVLWRGGG